MNVQHNARRKKDRKYKDVLVFNGRRVIILEGEIRNTEKLKFQKSNDKYNILWGLGAVCIIYSIALNPCLLQNRHFTDIQTDILAEECQISPSEILILCGENDENMKNLSKNQKLALFIYTVGVICVIYLLFRGFVGSDNVSNPQAMLPVTEFEASSILLGIGFIPMFISSLFVIRLFDVKKHLKRLFIFIPCIITVIPFIIIAGILILMFIRGYLEAFNLM